MSLCLSLSPSLLPTSLSLSTPKDGKGREVGGGGLRRREVQRVTEREREREQERMIEREKERGGE